MYLRILNLVSCENHKHVHVHFTVISDNLSFNYKNYVVVTIMIQNLAQNVGWSNQRRNDINGYTCITLNITTQEMINDLSGASYRISGLVPWTLK